MKPFEQLTDAEFERLTRDAIRQPDAPRDWVRAAVALWPAARPRGVAGALLDAVTAVLTFDSWAGAPLAGSLRGAATPERHLMYSAAGHDIDLRIAAAGEGYTLAGQILGPDTAGRVELSALDAAAPALQAELDSLGEFVLAPVAGGSYRLTLELAGRHCVLPDLQVGPVPA